MAASENHLIPPRTDQKKRATQVPARALAAGAVEAVLEKKAHDIVVMDMQQVSGVADYFVLCNGDSDLQIKAIADSVRGRLREQFQERPWHVEGYEHRQWVVLDYVDLVVHVFAAEKRTFYDLERLWGDAPKEVVPDDGTAYTVRLLQASPAVSAGQAGT